MKDLMEDQLESLKIEWRIESVMESENNRREIVSDLELSQFVNEICWLREFSSWYEDRLERQTKS
jgi:hypothetical protein